MKKKIFTVLLMLALGKASFAQYYYQMFYDPDHYASVTTNQLARMAAELVLTNQTDRIRDNVEAINKNMLKVAAAKQLVYDALVQVNGILKDGLETKFIAKLMAEIIGEAAAVTALAKDSPHLAVFAEERARAVKIQSVELFNELARFITKGGADAMMDYGKRDELLRNITNRLQLLRAEIQLMHQAMYWAKILGLWNSLNPFSDWINQDRSIINGILTNIKLIQQ